MELEELGERFEPSKNRHCSKFVVVPAPKWSKFSLVRLARSIKGRVKRKNNPGDWKEQKRSPRSPAQVMLRGSGEFALRRSISVLVTALSDSEARQAARLNVVNHGSI